ncbi:GTP-binding protein [Kitasatospora sp. NPDC087314]|uniref:GTP-binding protein n=1 Tax=Kitasatospora sp. NPDC087314 TaxID=3364068 RepID=UPI003821F18E
MRLPVRPDTVPRRHRDEYDGERRSELLFIGADLDRERLRALLDAALLDDGAPALGPEAWRRLPDPLLGSPDRNPPRRRLNAPDLHRPAGACGRQASRRRPPCVGRSNSPHPLDN